MHDSKMLAETIAAIPVLKDRRDHPHKRPAKQPSCRTTGSHHLAQSAFDEVDSHRPGWLLGLVVPVKPMNQLNGLEILLQASKL
jgi:hypothetical protein